MLALVPLHIIRTSATWQLADGDMIDIPGSPSHLHHLFGNLLGALAGAVNDKHPIIPLAGLAVDIWPKQRTSVPAPGSISAGMIVAPACGTPSSAAPHLSSCAASTFSSSLP